MEKWWEQLGALSKKHKQPFFTRDRMATLVLFVLIACLGFVAAKFHVTSILAPIFCYASGLLLLMELLSEASLAVMVDWLRLKKKRPLSEEEEISYNFAYASFILLVGPIDFWFKRKLHLLPGRAFVSDEQWHMHIYKLRFFAFLFLCLAVSFDLSGRFFES